MLVADTSPTVVALFALIPLLGVLAVFAWVYRHRSDDPEWKR